MTRLSEARSLSTLPWVESIYYSQWYWFRQQESSEIIQIVITYLYFYFLLIYILLISLVRRKHKLLCIYFAGLGMLKDWQKIDLQRKHMWAKQTGPRPVSRPTNRWKDTVEVSFRSANGRSKRRDEWIRVLSEAKIRFGSLRQWQMDILYIIIFWTMRKWCTIISTPYKGPN